MPEGPEVETIRRSLLPLLRGRRFTFAQVSMKKLREPTSERALAAVVGRRILGIDRTGKLLLIDVEGDHGLLVRFGMTGKLVVAARDIAPPPHTHVRLGLDGRACSEELRFMDPRRFGSVVPFRSAAERARALAPLGPDGLSLTSEARARVSAALAGTSRTLKDVLLDQRVLSGVGNIYAAEALFVARLSPFRRARALSALERERLLDAVEAVLRAAVGRRGTSFSDYVDGLGVPGENLAHLWVFQREGKPCRACGAAVVRKAQGQRSTFYCPRCQSARGRVRQVAERSRELG